jgi:hypothetical protein
MEQARSKITTPPAKNQGCLKKSACTFWSTVSGAVLFRMLERRLIDIQFLPRIAVARAFSSQLSAFSF